MVRQVSKNFMETVLVSLWRLLVLVTGIEQMSMTSPCESFVSTIKSPVCLDSVKQRWKMR